MPKPQQQQQDTTSEGNSRKPPPKDYLREMKSKRLQEAEVAGKRHNYHGVEIDKVLKNTNISEAEKYSMLRIKTD
jgi:hypothetical protein